MPTIANCWPHEKSHVAEAYLPLLAGTLLAILWSADQPAWVRMGLLCLAIYAGCKWLTFAQYAAGRNVPWKRACAYLLLWPGMDAAAFCAERKTVAVPRRGEYLEAVVKIVCGAGLLFWLAPYCVGVQSAWSAWIAATGMIVLFHCGAIHLLSIAWRANGVNALPIMRSPLLAASLSDFWGRRWNAPFHELMLHQVFRPLLRKVGPAWALLIAFAVSGAIHDLAMSLAAGGGWGRPTLYFLVQGAALLVERSALGRRCGLGQGLRGRVFAAAVILLPLVQLFHGPFQRNVILPLLAAISPT